MKHGDLRHLLLFDPVIKDELHFLVSRPAYNDLRSRLPEVGGDTQQASSRGSRIQHQGAFQDSKRPLAIYLTSAFKRRKLN